MHGWVDGGSEGRRDGRMEGWKHGCLMQFIWHFCAWWCQFSGFSPNPVSLALMNRSSEFH